MLPNVPQNAEPPPVTSGLIRAAAIGARKPQTELALLVGLSWPQWQRRMRGDVDWRLQEVQAIARVLDVPLDVLIAGEQ